MSDIFLHEWDFFVILLLLLLLLTPNGRWLLPLSITSHGYVVTRFDELSKIVPSQSFFFRRNPKDRFIFYSKIVVEIVKNM